MKVRPRRGHVFIMPLEEQAMCAADSLLIRHPDYVPICFEAKVIAIGKPEIKRKFRDGKWITLTDSLDVSAGTKILYPLKKAKTDLGHELSINGVTIRVFTYEQVRGCVVLEDQEAI